MTDLHTLEQARRQLRRELRQSRREVGQLDPDRLESGRARITAGKHRDLHRRDGQLIARKRRELAGMGHDILSQAVTESRGREKLDDAVEAILEAQESLRWSYQESAGYLREQMAGEATPGLEFDSADDEFYKQHEAFLRSQNINPKGFHAQVERISEILSK